jgi:predicted short-subunit dehydrogenase-like oxidoreductase (DUF2520 family)
MKRRKETRQDRFVMIGAGATASALGPALRAAGYDAAAVIGRDPDRAARLARSLGAATAHFGLEPRTGTWADLPDAELYCICVPDRVIPEVAEALARLSLDWKGRRVLHVSGGLDASPLAPVAARGAVTLAFHPVQTFTLRTDAGSFDGISVGVSGNGSGREAGLDLAARMGLRAVIVEDTDRPLYHLATALVSNGAVTLSAMAHEVLAACGIGGEESRRLLAPLVTATARNLASGEPGSVLTGPVVRGDAETVERHLARLAGGGSHLVPAVASLTTETVRLAVRSGRLDEDSAGRILEIISRFLDAEGHSPQEMEP